MQLKKIINRGEATPMLGVRNEVEPPFSRSLLRRRGPLIDLEKSTVETHRLLLCVCVCVCVDKARTWEGVEEGRMSICLGRVLREWKIRF